MPRPEIASGGDARMRLDKWLWAARFYKTRALAGEAVDGGKVHLNGQRTKPGKDVRIGSRLLISKDGVEWDIEIAVLPCQRRPASEARTFYIESEAGRERRERATAALQAARLAMPLQTTSKPNKRDRRLIHRFKQENA
ncbi:MAG: RNA-binding S4 domain-containing protein [Gammaproteobacteria bacterium]|nr:RNA-binding S4 domain-containing protein [Gammaproteobacteria bacterium]MCP5298631.1 RNA-binding S4 domain-containing protein [Chromatiaceae bacterium]